MKLNEAQNSFKELTLNPYATAELGLRPAGQLSQKQAFDVYRHGYVEKLSEALEQNFASIQWLLGKRIFADLCADYINQMPAITHNLREYGEEFPDFIKIHPTTRNIPFLKDMGRFEWIYQNIARAKSPEPLNKELCRDLIDSANFKIRFIPAMEIFESVFAISDIWNCHQSPTCEFEDIQWSRPENILLFKKKHQVLVHKLDRCQAAILLDLQEGALIATALASHASHLTVDDISSFFSFLIDSELIEDIMVLD